MKRKTISRMLALLLTACLCLSLGAAAFPEGETETKDNPANGTIEITTENIATNEGIIATNAEDFTVSTNSGTVHINFGAVETNTESGTVSQNSGTITENAGNVGFNTYDPEIGVGQITTNTETGTVGQNSGIITENAGNVGFNTNDPEIGVGQIKTNTETGTVDKNAGVITTNEGLIGVTDDNGAPTAQDGTGNFGTISINEGTVVYNDVDATIGTNTETGTVGLADENNTPVEGTGNYGNIDNNKGTVTFNAGAGDLPESELEAVVIGEDGGESGADPTESDYTGATIGTNEGTVLVNNGTVGLVKNEAGNPLEGTGNFGEIDTNSGMVVYNGGDATIGTNTKTGTVHDNSGTVEENSGMVENNRGTVEENSGTVDKNGGTVGSVDETGKMKSGNTGTVSRNDESGVVLNLEDGIVKKSYGEVYNYGGEVNESFGTEYFSVEIVNTTTYTKDESSGLKEAYGQQWLGQTGSTQTTATVILTPADGYKITLIAGLSDNVKAQRNDDGTWTLTIKSGSNITINVPEATEINAKPQPIPDPDPDPDPDPNPAPAPLPAPDPDPQPGPSRQDNLFVITYGDGSQVAYNLNVDSISATATEPAPAAPITPPAQTERTVKGTVDHATHLEKVDDVVNQLEGNTLTALQNGNAVFAAAFDVQNADMLDSGIVDFGGAFEEAEEDVILVPSVSGQYFENNTYTVVYSDGTVVHAVCTNAGVLWIPFPHDAKGLAFVVLKGTVESSQLVKHTILAAETLDSGAGSVTLQFDANQVAGPIVDGIHNEVHVQNTGWTGRARDGELAGTTGQSRRLEAVRVSLTGDALMDDYSVWYRVHSQTYGWLGWAHDGEPAGTAGLAKRAEAIDVQVLPQGQVPRGYDSTQRAPAANTAGTTEAASAAGGPAADPDIIRDNDALVDAAIKSALEDARNARQTNNANAAGTTTEATSAAGGDAADTGSFDDDDLAALYADALNSILENGQNARNAQRSAANANAAGTTEATTAAVNRGDVADNAQQTNNANALGVYSPTGDHSGALGD